MALIMLRGEARTKTHGGKRRNAGRKRSRFRRDAPHRMRARFSVPSPVHVTMRGQPWICGLRSDLVYRVLHAVLALYKDRPSFRVIHISIQDNHLHLLVEASNDHALDRGMRSFAINAARAIHAAFGTEGRVFFRYFSTVIKTRRYARNVIAYVLGNWRRHRQDFANGRLLDALLDRYSSAVSFPGWSIRFAIPQGYAPLPVSQPSTELLRTGWAIDGPLDPRQAPGPL
jgi:REP element-mobilizing transposase RayT